MTLPPMAGGKSPVQCCQSAVRPSDCDGDEIGISHLAVAVNAAQIDVGVGKVVPPELTFGESADSRNHCLRN